MKRISPMIVTALLLFGNATEVLFFAQSADSQQHINSVPTLVRPIRDFAIPENVPFKFNLRTTGSVTFGYDVGGSDISVTDNYFASYVSFPKPWENVLFTNNVLTARDQRVVSLDMPIASADEYTWDCNTYYCGLAKPFSHDGSRTWDQWRQRTNFDRRSCLINGNPPDSVFVRANRYEPGRGHVIVYNWDRSKSVQVDLSPIVRTGKSYKIYNVLDLHGEPVMAGLYDGGKVSVPMSAARFPAPIGHQLHMPLMMDAEFSTFLVISNAPRLPTSGNSYFVSTTGSSQGDGSWLNPWDLTTALLHPDPVQPGDTIWLRGGTYRGEFASKLSGTASKPIVLRQLPGEDVKIDLYDKATGAGSVFTIEGKYAWYWGFELFSSDPSARATSETGSWPKSISRGDFVVTGDQIRLINLEIHDLRQGLAYWSTGIGGEIHGLIIYNNGWTSFDRNHGHAIYTQNAGAVRRLVDNITFNQFRNGITAYGSSDSVLKDLHIEGNVSFANGGAVGEGYLGSFQLLIGGGSEAENITVTNNFTYDLPHHFRDQDFDDRLVFAAEQVDGRPLPPWLEFDQNEGYFYGTPSSEDIGAITIRVTALDAAKAEAVDIFRVRVANVNEPPTLIEPLDDMELNRGDRLSIDLSGHFADQDDFDKLTMTVTLADGSELPDWLTFDPDTALLASESVVAPVTIKVIATDIAGATVSDLFEIVGPPIEDGQTVD